MGRDTWIGSASENDDDDDAGDHTNGHGKINAVESINVRSKINTFQGRLKFRNEEKQLPDLERDCRPRVGDRFIVHFIAGLCTVWK